MAHLGDATATSKPLPLDAAGQFQIKTGRESSWVALRSLLLLVGRNELGRLVSESSEPERCDEGISL
ncbi:hypothetical protein EYF80_012459 [Liparis tanakae]|uniref:Uncharacterized protein n=1 Tax=Liparis tanakae TaxID=230148 RepID=A0A4Z2II30_9TELE|nr:hypothetical protein EYF80_012459 [Liparis tanakae]